MALRSRAVATGALVVALAACTGRSSEPSASSPAAAAAPSPAQASSPTAQAPASPEPPPGAAPAASTPAPGVPAPAAAPGTPPPTAVKLADDPAAPRPLPVFAVQAIEPSGPVALRPAEESLVDASAHFRVEVPLPLPDARVVLLDAGDALVPTSGVREVGDATAFELTPSAPLRPGSRYHLRIEGADGRTLRDRAGAHYAPVSVKLLVAGTPAPPEPAKKPAKKAVHRRAKHR